MVRYRTEGKTACKVRNGSKKRDTVYRNYESVVKESIKVCM